MFLFFLEKMKSIKGTRTEKNLMQAFAGECQARMRYDYFAKVANKEGYKQIAGIFEETAANEVQHAKRFFRFLEGGMVEITASFPAGVIGTTEENLKAAAKGEHEERAELYPAFGKVAKEEGFDEIAECFFSIADAEKAHDKRYSKLVKNLEEGIVFKRGESYIWKCRNCGYLHEGLEAPKECPSCLHPQGHFQIKGINY